jgi:hypothetical protein
VWEHRVSNSVYLYLNIQIHLNSHRRRRTNGWTDWCRVRTNAHIRPMLIHSRVAQAVPLERRLDAAKQM